ncbi:cytosolic sulfotransferase 8-like [Andrographis paniculata]|uniref:cytosolic sulfotransferase 8-like n=1 Tax=Andrographis paniculata TaxID=175694 RepID=UPI0021E764CF|nr:cytosolic sulfotransferase 8-like [Andrographis paniculata]
MSWSNESSYSQPIYMQQEDAIKEEELKTFVSTLPHKKTHFGPSIYQYQGFWYPLSILSGVMNFQRNFHSQSSDIFTITFPKSGTTWLKSLLFTLSNRRQFPVNDANHPILTANPHQLVPTLEIALYIKDQNPNLDHLLSSPRLLGSHLPWTVLPEPIKNSSTNKIVYLCRNPKDVFVSLWHYENQLVGPNKMGLDSFKKSFESFCEGLNLSGPFWDHILDYWKESKKNPGKIFFLKYEDMKEQPGLHLRRLAEFLDCPFSSDEEESGLVEDIVKLCSFENLSNLEVNKNGKVSQTGMHNSAFFRKGKTGDWKSHLSEEMILKLDGICNDKLGGFGIGLGLGY